MLLVARDVQEAAQLSPALLFLSFHSHTGDQAPGWKGPDPLKTASDNFPASRISPFFKKMAVARS